MALRDRKQTTVVDELHFLPHLLPNQAFFSPENDATRSGFTLDTLKPTNAAARLHSLARRLGLILSRSDIGLLHILGTYRVTQVKPDFLNCLGPYKGHNFQKIIIQKHEFNCSLKKSF